MFVLSVPDGTSGKLEESRSGGESTENGRTLHVGNTGDVRRRHFEGCPTHKNPEKKKGEEKEDEKVEM